MRRFVPGFVPARSLAAGATAAMMLAVIAGAAGCQGEPSLLCDRMRVVWPFFTLDPSLDSSPDEGLQIDLALRSTIHPGTSVFLSVQGEEGEPVQHPEPSIAASDGGLLFTDVNIPLGRVTLRVTAENQCGDLTSSRRPFVWDGQGMPICELDIGVDAAEEEALAPFRVLRAEHDADPDTAGMQLDVSVVAGRPDVEIGFFALDLASGEQQVFRQESGDDLAGAFSVTLGEGGHVLRSVCLWEPGGLRPSSPSFRLWVDTVAPDCSLVAPQSRVRVADDLDPDTAGVQFELRGSSASEDVPGLPASFTVQGNQVEGSEVDGEGISTATATIAPEPGVAQEFSFRARDAAGNQCEDSVTFP